MPLRTDPYWALKAKEMAPNMSSSNIYLELKREAEAAGRIDNPSLRTVQRLRANPLPAFHWPNAMEGDKPALPWEASAVALQVLGLYQAEGRGRPSQERVLWHWRLHLAGVSESGLDFRSLDGLVDAVLWSSRPDASPYHAQSWRRWLEEMAVLHTKRIEGEETNG
jgi:hypothetical protein